MNFTIRTTFVEIADEILLYQWTRKNI